MGKNNNNPSYFPIHSDYFSGVQTMKIEFNFATGDSNVRIHTVLVNDSLFGVLVIRNNTENPDKCAWSVFNRTGMLVDGGYGDKYGSFHVKEEIEEILAETLKGEYGYE